MKKIEAYIKSERLKDTLKQLASAGVPGFTYYNVTGHGKEATVKAVAALESSIIIVDNLPRTKIEVVCEDSDVEKIIDVIRGGCCTLKPGDGMAFVIPVTDAYRLRSKEKLKKIE